LKIIYELNNIIFTAGAQLYSTQISFGDRAGADWGDDDPLALP